MTRKSKLFTEEPHYLPKYCGYLPQYKYRIGKTYGRHSVEILTDDGVKKSGKYVLTPLNIGDEYGIEDNRRQILSSRTVGFGNQNLVNDMLPGYTGYIPKRQHYFAKRYADVCSSAIAHHEIEHQEQTTKQQQLKRIVAMQNGDIQPVTATENSILRQQRHSTPLKPISRSTSFPTKRFVSSNAFKPSGSPYSLPNDDDMKWFKTGFTGFVPRTRDLIALDYKRQCNTGLRRFTDHQQQVRNQTDDVIQRIQRPQTDGQQATKRNVRIYPVDRGMLPKYTGYIPGYKYEFGQTYGQHTHNTLKLPAA